MVVAAPAEAVDIPAYGSITIADEGAGMQPVWTYDPAMWDCGTEVTGPFNAPSAVTVECDLIPVQDYSFACPLMVLTTQTSGLVARAGGRATCTGTLDTGVISGVNSAQRTGNLGRAYSITCSAYTNSVALVPPYRVTCTEPGLPVASADLPLG